MFRTIPSHERDGDRRYREGCKPAAVLSATGAETLKQWQERNEREIEATLRPAAYPDPRCQWVPAPYRHLHPSEWAAKIKEIKRSLPRNLPKPARIKTGPTRRDKIWAKTNGFCYLCDLPLMPSAWTIDHVIPTAKGGSNALPNLMPAHFKCNCDKGDSWPTPEMLDKLMAAS